MHGHPLPLLLMFCYIFTDMYVFNTPSVLKTHDTTIKPNGSSRNKSQYLSKASHCPLITTNKNHILTASTSKHINNNVIREPNEAAGVEMNFFCSSHTHRTGCRAVNNLMASKKLLVLLYFEVLLYLWLASSINLNYHILTLLQYSRNSHV